MKKLRKLRVPRTKEGVFVKKINELITQNNEQVDEIRLIKSKLRVNATFGKRRK